MHKHVLGIMTSHSRIGLKALKRVGYIKSFRNVWLTSTLFKDFVSLNTCSRAKVIRWVASQNFYCMLSFRLIMASSKQRKSFKRIPHRIQNLSLQRSSGVLLIEIVRTIINIFLESPSPFAVTYSY